MINCELDNIVPRNYDSQINFSTYADNILYYETYSLIYCKNSNLTVTDIILRKSNIGIIAVLNSTVNYEGNTKIEFYGYGTKENIGSGTEKINFFGFLNSGRTGFNQSPFYDSAITLNATTPILSTESEQLEFDFDNPILTDDSTYIPLYWLTNGVTIENFQNILYTQSIINYAAENSCITMFPYSNIYNIAQYNKTQTTPLTAKDIENEFNFILGNQQFGSLFNHTHVPMNLTIDGAAHDKKQQILDRLQKKLNESRTYKFDSFPGMISRQFAGSLFELNDPNESIGYQYIDISKNSRPLLWSARVCPIIETTSWNSPTVC